MTLMSPLVEQWFRQEQLMIQDWILNLIIGMMHIQEFQDFIPKTHLSWLIGVTKFLELLFDVIFRLHPIPASDTFILGLPMVELM